MHPGRCTILKFTMQICHGTHLIALNMNYIFAPRIPGCRIAVIPQAQIVINKFHFVRMANDAMERARKSLRERLTLKARWGLMHDRFVLLKRERDLSDKERLLLSGWFKNCPELGEAP